MSIELLKELKELKKERLKEQESLKESLKKEFNIKDEHALNDARMMLNIKYGKGWKKNIIDAIDTASGRIKRQTKTNNFKSIRDEDYEHVFYDFEEFFVFG